MPALIENGKLDITKVYKIILSRNVMLVIFLFLFVNSLFKLIGLQIRKQVQLIAGVSHKIDIYIYIYTKKFKLFRHRTLNDTD